MKFFLIETALLTRAMACIILAGIAMGGAL